MSISFYKEFVRENQSDREVTDAFDKLLAAQDGEAIEIEDKTSRRLSAALSRMTQNPQFKLMAAGLQLRLGDAPLFFLPRLFRDENPAKSLIPTADEIFADLDKNLSIQKRFDDAHGPEARRTTLLVTARTLPRVRYEMFHDSGLIWTMLGGLYMTGGGIHSGMEFGNAGAEATRLVYGQLYNNAHTAIWLPFENPSIFPVAPQMRASSASFFARKMGSLYGSDAYDVGVGGYGTMDEWLGTLALIQNGAMAPKDAVLLDATTDGKFWGSVLAYVNKLIDDGAIDPKLRGMTYFAADQNDQAGTAAFLLNKAENERAEGTRFDERFTVAHRDRDAVLRGMIRHDRELIAHTLASVDRKRTISLFAPEGPYAAEFASDAAALIAGLDTRAAFEGANILVSGSGAFGETAALAAKNLTRGALLSVERVTDEKSPLAPSEKAGKLQFYTDPFYNAALMYHSGAAVFYPGGLNVQAALFELMTLQQTRQLPRLLPLVLVGGHAKWGHFLDLARTLCEYGTIIANDLEYDPKTGEGMFRIVDTAEEALAFLEQVGFTHRLPQVVQKPHKEPSKPEEDYVKLYVREYMKHGFTPEEAEALAHRSVYEARLDPAAALNRSAELLATHPRAREELDRRDMRLGPNAYTRMVAASLAATSPQSLGKLRMSREEQRKPRNLTGKILQAAQRALAEGQSPVTAARKLVGPVGAQDLKFALHPGMKLPAGHVAAATPLMAPALGGFKI